MKPSKIAIIIAAVLAGGVVLAVLTSYAVRSKEPPAPKVRHLPKKIEPAKIEAVPQRPEEPLARKPAIPERPVEVTKPPLREPPSREPPSREMVEETSPERERSAPPISKFTEESANRSASQNMPAVESAPRSEAVLPLFVPITNSIGPTPVSPSAATELPPTQQLSQPPQASAQSGASQPESSQPVAVQPADITNFIPQTVPGGPPVNQSRQSQQLPSFTPIQNKAGPVKTGD